MNRFEIFRFLTRFKIRSPTVSNNAFRSIVPGKNVVSPFMNNQTNRFPKPCWLIGGVLTYFGLQEKSEAEKESELITTIKRGILLIQKEEYKKAEQMLHIALKIAQEQSNADGITYIYDVLANLAYDTGDYKKAEKLFVTVMQRIMSSGAASDDNKIIHMSLKLSNIYETRSETEKAENGYQFCLENLERKVLTQNDRTEDTLLLLAMVLDMYAHFLLSMKRVSEAFAFLKKSYEYCKEVYGEEHKQSVILLNDLGTIANIMGNQDTALNYLQEAVETGKRIPDLAELAAIYVNLGNVYLMKEMYSESRKACETGRRSARDAHDAVTEKEAKLCLNNIKDVLHA